MNPTSSHWRTAALVALWTAASVANATSFAPYSEQRIADANGRYYVIVKRKETREPLPTWGPVALTIAEARAGSPPVRSGEARDATGREAPIDPRIRVRDGDQVRCSIDLPRPPGAVHVSTTGVVVLLDWYGLNDVGPNAGAVDAVVYSVQGERLHKKSRQELFHPAARLRFPRIDGSLWWLYRSWIDEKRNSVVIVGAAPRGQPQLRPVISMDLNTGEVSRGGTEPIDRAIMERNASALNSALDLARDMKLHGSKASWPGILGDSNIPLSGQLRTAVLLAELDDRRGADLFSRTMTRAAEPRSSALRTSENDDFDYAIENAPKVLGEAALPLLKKVLQQRRSSNSSPMTDAFRSLGVKGVPTLISLLEDDSNFDAQYQAATCLGYLGANAEAAVPALIKALHKKNSKDIGWTMLRLSDNAVWALGLIGDKATAAVPDLERLSSDPDERVSKGAREAIQAIKGE